MTEPKSKKEAKMVIIEPVEGYYLNDVPAARQEVTAERAEELVATGAFVVVEE